MNNFLNKITAWFKPQPVRKIKPKKDKTLEIKKPYSFNSKYYRQLIGQLARRTIAIERRRSQEKKGGKNDWLPIYHECGWKGKVNISWAKSIFTKQVKEGPAEFAYNLIITCRSCKATQGLRYTCVYGQCSCHKKEIKNE